MVKTDTFIQFKVVDREDKITDPETCYLIKNTWDDFGFKTTFDLYFVNKMKKRKNLGRVSIASKGMGIGSVSLPGESFSQLSTSYFSLGQSQSYYEELRDLEEKYRKCILMGLRDCAYQNQIFEEFKEEEALNTALLRHVSVGNVIKLFPDILKGISVPTPFKFHFKLNDINNSKIEVDVKPYSTPPSNVHVLIGRNGVGKTRILSGLADSITGNKFRTMSLKGEVEFFEDQYDFEMLKSERFANLITVEFSAFDYYQPIISDPFNSKIICHYIGLKSNDGNHLRTLSSMTEDFQKSLKTCLTTHRKDRWIEAIQILNSDPILKDYELDKYPYSENIKRITKIFDELSSGHKIILLTITKLVEFVDEKTLVLIDELENHLHPPLLLSYIRAISNLLIKRNGVAIIATHSPVVLQEVPKSCVTNIERVGERYSLYRPNIETYGENIGTLTREVFGLELLESGFYKTIDNFLTNGKNYDDIMDKFSKQIGSEGRAIARSIIASKRNKDA